MSREATIQLGALYGPLMAAVILTIYLRPKRRLAIGLTFSTIWLAVTLPWLDLTARALGLWSYQASGPALAGMPLALYFGWVIAWGWLAPLAGQALGRRWPLVPLTLLGFDLCLMPQLEPVVTLQSAWWIGEFALLAGLLVPAMLLCRWTHTNTRLEPRVRLLAACFGGLLLGIPLLASARPEASFSGILRLIDQPLWLAAAFLLALPGVTAMRDLARTGGGTPVPLDPPRRLVCHGIYAFVSNPMQYSMISLLLLEAAYLASIWPLVIAGLGVIYSEGFARWSEGQDMARRFGPEWAAYRSRVSPWIPRWTPVIPQACELWVDHECAPCTSVGDWFARHQASGLQIRPARQWPGAPLQRITWHDPLSGRQESGIRAIAIALQHLSLPWALAGLILGAPGLSWILQCCLDAAGAGPKEACQTSQ